MPRGTKHLTAEQLERIRELHQTGRNTQQIVKAIGCTVDQARHALKRLGLKAAWSRNGACYRNADRIREWAAQGVSLSEIARRIGTNHTRVTKYLTRHDIRRIPFLQSGENNPAWKGGRMLDKDGYVLIHMPDHPGANRHGYVREHRWVMEQLLGRFLTDDEVVHHNDDNHQNNDLSNLTLFASNRDHLAETLKGRCPEWTEEGLKRIEERWSRLGAERRASSQSHGKGPDDPPLPGMTDLTSA